MCCSILIPIGLSIYVLVVNLCMVSSLTPPPQKKNNILSKDSASPIFRHPFLQNTILISSFGKGNPKFLVSIQCTCQVQVFWNSSDRSEPQVAKIHGLLQEVAVEFGTASSHGSLTGQTNFCHLCQLVLQSVQLGGQSKDAPPALSPLVLMLKSQVKVANVRL